MCNNSVGDHRAPDTGLAGLAGLPGKEELQQNENVGSIQAQLMGPRGTAASEQTSL